MDGLKRSAAPSEASNLSEVCCASPPLLPARSRESRLCSAFPPPSVLLLLSGKKASEINTVQGKQQLAGEILAVVKQPFTEHGDEQEVSDVLFTSFIIQ